MRSSILFSPQEVADEAWSDYKRRNDSIIIDLFHGQLKSHLECPNKECENISVTFDPFCYLSLPLPRKLDRVIKFTFISKYAEKRPIRVSDVVELACMNYHYICSYNMETAVKNVVMLW